jgi:hypothetical protein
MSCVPRRPSITFITDMDSGIVWNAFSTSGVFTIPGSSQPASFIFATLDGLIVESSLPSSTPQTPRLAARIDVFDSRFNLVSSFDTDAKVPTGFAPYGIPGPSATSCM